MAMMRKPKQAFFIDDNPHQNNSYIFDPMYKTVRDKNKFQKDPRFSYFNLITKMKNKLGQNQHEVYEKIFDSQPKMEATRWRNTFSGDLSPQKNKGSIGFIESSNKISVGKNIKIKNSVHEINFSMQHQRSKSEYAKPRLDDIIAEYRRMARRKQKQKTKSTSFTASLHRKNLQQIQILKQNQSFSSKQRPSRNRSHF